MKTNYDKFIAEFVDTKFESTKGKHINTDQHINFKLFSEFKNVNSIIMNNLETIVNSKRNHEKAEEITLSPAYYNSIINCLQNADNDEINSFFESNLRQLNDLIDFINTEIERNLKERKKAENDEKNFNIDSNFNDILGKHKIDKMKPALILCDENTFYRSLSMIIYFDQNMHQLIRLLLVYLLNKENK